MTLTEKILTKAIEEKVSDVHINVGLAPIFRRDTELFETDLPVIDEKAAQGMLKDMVSEKQLEKFEQVKDLDFATKIASGHRFRVNAHYQNNTIAMAFRAISNNIPDLELLNLPVVIAELTKLPRGLVLVTGPTGSGKSTTLASMLGAINNSVRRHIITLEDPIEYELNNNMCVIEQREVGFDCPTFASGLKHILRQDPDIVMVGEMRDLETTGATITAAETGHLVFSTLHTVNAAQTVERIIDIYPATQQAQIRSMLANTLQAVLSQTLFRRIDKPGMVPCVEILLCNPAVRNCIRENRIYEIPNIIETSRKAGMQTLDHSIADMFNRGFIDRDEAISRSSNPAKMEQMLKQPVMA